MIKTFKHKGLKKFFLNGDVRGITNTHSNKLRLILTKLNAIASVSDMNFPGSGLHELKGELNEFWSISVNGNWRIIFRVKENDVFDVDYLDYH
jgi:proteic killer suppression protein